MRGHSRIRKKLLKQAGWVVTEDARKDETIYRLVLENRDGDQKVIEAATKPRAYYQAEQEILQTREA